MATRAVGRMDCTFSGTNEFILERLWHGCWFSFFPFSFCLVAGLGCSEPGTWLCI